MSATIGSGASSILPEAVRSTSGSRSRIAPMSIPCGLASSFARVRPSASAPKPSPNGPTRRRKSIRRSGPRRSPSAAAISSTSRPSIGDPASPTSRPISVRITRSSHASMSASAPWPAAIAASRRMISHSCGRPSAQRQDRRRPVRDAADGELVERGVVVRLRQRLGSGKDHVGVPGGLVDVDVDADHEVEVVDGVGERLRVGRRDERVARDRDQRAHLALARRRDLPGERRPRAARRMTRAGRATRLVQRPVMTPLPVRPRPTSCAGPRRRARTSRRPRDRGCR